MEATGIHSLLCSVGGHIAVRHDGIRDELAALLRETVTSPVHVEPHDGQVEGDKHPDIMWWDARGDQVWADVAIVTPTPRTVASTSAMSDKEGVLVRHHEGYKRRKYPHLNLVPACFETFGRPGESMVALVRSFGDGLDDAKRSECISNAWRRLQTALARGNAAILAGAGALIPP